MSGQSQITTALRPDLPLVQNAGYQLDGPDRQRIDDQILGCQQHLADNLINGVIASWFTLDGASPALVAGDVFCLGSTTSGSVTLATPAMMSTAGIVLGIALQAAAAGSKVRGAIGGLVSARFTALAAGAAGVARLSTAGRVEVVSSYVPGDYPLGFVDLAGWLTLVRAYPVGSINVGALVMTVTAAAPATSTGGLNPVIGIVPASGTVPGSLSAADYAKIQQRAPGTFMPLIAPATQTLGAATGGLGVIIAFASPTAASRVSIVEGRALGSLVSDATNNRTLNIFDADAAGAFSASLYTITTTPGGTGNWSAGAPVFSWTANYTLPAGHSLVAQWSSNNAGVVFPGLSYRTT